MPDHINVWFVVVFCKIEISNAPRRGGIIQEASPSLPLITNSNWFFSCTADGRRSHNSLKMSVALRLKTCQDLQASMAIINSFFFNFWVAVAPLPVDAMCEISTETLVSTSSGNFFAISAYKSNQN